MLVEIQLIEASLDSKSLSCSAWQFDKATEAEIDEELGWGPPPLMTGSYIDPTKTEHGAQKQAAETKDPRRSACCTTVKKR